MATKQFDKERSQLMSEITEFLTKSDYEVLVTNSNELCVPIVNEQKEEGYLVLVFKVPTGSRDGDVYDGYVMAEDYAMKCKVKKEKAEEKAKAKALKIERDKKMREEKAKMKAEREKRGE